MNKFHRIFWPALMAFGVLGYLTFVHFLSLGNPYYVYNDGIVNAFLFLVPIGVIGSLINIYARFGLKKSSPVLITWSIALLSIVFLYTGDDPSSLGWAMLAYPAVIIGSLLIIFYIFRHDPK